MDFEKVIPVYTGGGIYVFYGKIKGGNFFLASDESFFYDVMEIDTDPKKINFDDLWQWDFMKAHMIREYTGKRERYNFHKAMYKWIIKNEPKDEGTNYDIDDIEAMAKDLKLSNIYD